MQLSAICAMAPNRAIGFQNKLPWHIPEELQWFKKITSGKPILMGHNTYKSIGRLLPNRLNIILSRSPLSIPGATCIQSISQIPSASLNAPETFIIGGSQIYHLLFPYCSHCFLSIIHSNPPNADTFLPPFEHLFPHHSLLHQFQDFSVHLFSNPSPKALPLR